LITEIEVDATSEAVTGLITEIEVDATSENVMTENMVAVEKVKVKVKSLQRSARPHLLKQRLPLQLQPLQCRKVPFEQSPSQWRRLHRLRMLVPRALRRNPRRRLHRVRRLQWLRWLRWLPVWQHLDHLDHLDPLHRAHHKPHPHLHPKRSHIPSQCVQDHLLVLQLL